MSVLFLLLQLPEIPAHTIGLERNPPRPTPPAYPRLRLYDESHEVVDRCGDLALVRTLAEVECWVTASPAAIGTQLNALYASVVRTVLASVRLGNSVEGLSEVDLTVEISRESATPIGVLTVQFAIEHESRPATAETRGREVVLKAVEDVLASGLLPAAPSVRETATAAMVARLGAGLSGVTVLRNAPHKVALADHPRVVVVHDGPEAVSHDVTGGVWREQTHRIDCLATAAKDDDAGDAVNALADEVRQVLEADPNLGGAVFSCGTVAGDPHVTPVAFVAPAMGVTLTVPTRYATATRDPAEAPRWAA